MRTYTGTTVLDAARARIAWLFDEFATVAVSFSGGKDSTVLFHLTLEEARRRDRLPLPVLWLDQECEFESTVNYTRTVMHHPDVAPYWLQVPFRLLNATSAHERWLNVWGEGEQWVREKEPDSIHENTFGTDRFVRLLTAVGDTLFRDGVVLTGTRAEENPRRLMGLTSFATYKWATWGAKRAHHVTMSPLYDWSYVDIWTAIHRHGWPYCPHYDAMYRYGRPPKDMRVSNYHHETALDSLFMLQEIEPHTYERATARLAGLSSAVHLGPADYYVRDLPYMFKDWEEYRDYLVDHLIADEAIRAGFRQKFAAARRIIPWALDDAFRRGEVNAVLANDLEFTKIENMIAVYRHKQALLEQKERRSRAAR